MSIRLAVIGASGRAGSEVLKVLPEFPAFALSSAVVSPRSKHLGQNCPVPYHEQRFSADLESAIRDADGVIEFSGAVSSVRVADLCARYQRPVVIASSGQNADQLASLRRASERCPILISANLSTAVHVLKQLCLTAQRMLGSGFQAEIFEIHHQHKKDAPSGTALTLGKAMSEAGGLSLVPARGAEPGARTPDSVGVASLRGGEVLGEHTVFFLGQGERIELTHRTSDRGIFARGGLRALEALMGKSAGLYQMADLIR